MELGQIPGESNLVTDPLKEQLTTVFGKLNKDIYLKAVIDSGKDKPMELASFLKAVSETNPRISLEVYDIAAEEVPLELKEKYLPVVGLYSQEGYTGIAFCGVPGGQEINSFVKAIYNVAGPGEKLAFGMERKIKKLEKPAKIKVCVSLACHHCPAAVTACQRIASLNPVIEADMIDARLYPDLVDTYKIERVPVIIINDRDVFVGPKDMDEMVNILKRI